MRCTCAVERREQQVRYSSLFDFLRWGRQRVRRDCDLDCVVDVVLRRVVIPDCLGWQEYRENRKRLDDEFNGTAGLARYLRVDFEHGLSASQVGFAHDRR